LARHAFFAVLALASTLAGCSSQDKPLITVGSQKVTVRDYEHTARGAQMQYEGPPATAKATFVQDLERRALMLEEAHRLGLARDASVLNVDRENEQRALLQAFYGRVASPSQRVSDAEARSLYEARKVEADLWLLYTSSEESSRAAKARLARGEPFANVSRSYSVPGLLPPDGALGWIAPGALPDPLDGALRTQKLGEVGGPYHTREGWFLVKVANRRPHEQGSFESMRAGMIDLMRQRKQRAAFNRAYMELKAEYDVNPAPGGAQLLFRVEAAADPLTPTPDQRQMPLATYRGGVYTLNDALLDLQRADTQKPAFNLLPSVEIWIEQQVMTRVAVIEARRRHLHEEPDLVANLRAQHDQMLLNQVYQMAVAAVPAAGPELVQMAWNRVRKQYTKLDMARVALLEVTDSTFAERVQKQHSSSPMLADAAKAVDPSLKVTVQDVHYPSTDANWQVLQAMFTSQQPGAWYGPERTPKGWRFLQLVDKQMSEEKFEELPQGLQQNIAGAASELARDQRFNEYTDSLKTAFRPVVDTAAIARMPWPVPQPVADGGR